MLTERQIKALARKIATNMFTSGRDERAERLLLWKDSVKKDLGGWGFDAVCYLIASEVGVAMYQQSVKGAKKAAANMTPKQRSSRAKKASETRWGGKRKTPG